MKRAGCQSEQHSLWPVTNRASPSSAAPQAVVRAIRLNNPGRPIPRARVLGFPSVEAANAYELANPQTVAGGLFFQRDPLGNLAFVVQSNSTVRSSLALCPSPPAC